MNNSNPLVPQGSNLEQKIKGRSRVKLAVLCVLAAHVLFLGPLLIQGCKREQPLTTAAETNAIPPLETLTNDLPQFTNAFTPLPPVETNAVVPPAVVETPPSATEYAVVKGDSFYSIGKKFGVSIKAIADANPGVDSTKLKLGQKLMIPAPTPKPPTNGEAVLSPGGETIYTVKSGDTLSKIAADHHTTVKAIQQANNLSITTIRVGQKLKIPASKSTAPPAK